MLPAEPDDPERAGLAVAAASGPREAGKGRKGRTALKRKRNRCGRLKPLKRKDTMAELVEGIIRTPERVQASGARGRARVKPPEGMTRLDQLLRLMARTWADPAMWLTSAEIEGAARSELPRDDVKLLLGTGCKKGWIEVRQVKDPIKEQVVPAPGGYVPRRLWRLTRAGRAWVALVG